MPALLHARPPTDPAEERRLRKLAAARHAPASWIQLARIITGSWDGASVAELARRLDCHPKTVSKWLHRFNTSGIDALADLPRPGVPRHQRAPARPHHRPGPLGAARPAAPGRRGAAGARPARGAGALDAGRPGPGRPGRGDRRRPQPGPPDPAQRAGALAAHAVVGDQHRSRFRPKRAQVIACYTSPPPDMTVVCADELGPVIPRSFPPAPGWTLDGHRVKSPLDYGRGPEKTWVYGALRVRDGQTVTLTTPSRNSVGYQDLLGAVEAANPVGTIMVITDNLSSHTSVSTRTWLTDHPRIQHTFIPKGACWLNLQEGWWRLFRREAFAGQSFATPKEITLATSVATCQLNARARPWVWGRPLPSPRYRRHAFTYRI